MSGKTFMNILIVLIFVLLIGGGYYYLTNNQPTAPTDTLSNDQVIDGEGPAADVLRLLQQVQAVTLDGKIFQNPAFSQFLVNYTTELPDKPRGRSNPFANFGVGNLTTANTFSASAPVSNAPVTAPTTSSTMPPVPSAQ